MSLHVAKVGDGDVMVGEWQLVWVAAEFCDER